MLASRSLLCSLTSALRVNLRHKTPAYTASGVTRKYSRSIAPLRPSHLQAMAITGPAVTSSDLQSWFTNQDLRTAWGTPKGLPDPEHPGQLTVSSGAWGAYDLPGDPSAYLITHSGETTVVAFPGSHNYNDWVSDLTFKTVEITNGFIPAGTLQVNQRVEEKMDPAAGVIHMHKGFLERWKTICSDKFLQTLRQELSKAGTKKLIITGHSLGGAIALVATLWYIQHREEGWPADVQCVTFGAPFVGNDVLADEVYRKKWEGHMLQVVTRHDVVPRLLISTSEGGRAVTNNVEELLSDFLSLWGALELYNVKKGIEQKEEKVKKAAAGTRSLWMKIQGVASTILDGTLTVLGAPIKVAEALLKGGPIAAAVLDGIKEASIYRPFGNYVMHTDAGAITPCSDRNKVLHLLLVTLRHRSAGVDVDPTVIVREHMSDRYLQAVSGLYAVDLKSPVYKNMVAFYTDAPDAASFGMMYAIENLAKELAEQVQQPLQEVLGLLKNGGRAEDLMALWTQNAQQASDAVSDYIHNYKGQSNSAYDEFRMSPRGRDSPTHDVDVQRRTLKNFWEGAAQMAQLSTLPATAMQYGVDTWKLLEPLDIANYYRLKLWIGSGPYLAGQNRPSCYPYFESIWAAAHPDDPYGPNTTETARKEQAAVDNATVALDKLRTAVDGGAPVQALRDAAVVTADAVASCRLPKTMDAAAKVVTLVNQGAAAVDVAAAVQELETQFRTTACEN